MSATGVISTEFGVFINNTTAAGAVTSLTIANPGRSFQIIGFDVYDTNQPTAAVTVRKNLVGGDIAAQGTTAVDRWNLLPISATLANTQFSSTDNIFVDLVAAADIKGVFIRMIANPSQALTIVQT